MLVAQYPCSVLQIVFLPTAGEMKHLAKDVIHYFLPFQFFCAQTVFFIHVAGV